MLYIVPCSLREANGVVARLHRHHRPVPGHKFSLAVMDGIAVRGVTIIGRPISRMLDDGLTLEVTRVATDGCPNACSALYGAAWRATRAMGYRRLLTYTLPAESGASLRGAGWMLMGEAGGGSWSSPSRPRRDRAPTCPKVRWQREVAAWGCSFLPKAAQVAASKQTPGRRRVAQMQVTDDEINEFIAICREAFHQDLSVPEAREIATRFLHLLDILARPLPTEGSPGVPCPPPLAELS